MKSMLLQRRYVSTKGKYSGILFGDLMCDAGEEEVDGRGDYAVWFEKKNDFQEIMIELK